MRGIYPKKVMGDIAALLVLFLMMLMLFHHIDMFEELVEFVESHEDWELDEWILVVLFSPIGFLWFISRRWHDERAYIASTLKREAEFSYQLKFDTETKLANRAFFECQLDIMIEHGVNQNQPLTVMVIKVEHLEHLKKSVSSEAYHQYIAFIANIISDSAPYGAKTARLSEDVFAIAVNFEAPEGLLLKISSEATLPAFLLTYGLELKFGYVKDALHNSSLRANTLIHRATSSVYSGQLNTNTGFYVFNSSDTEEQEAESARRSELKKAIESEELELFLQPQMDAVTDTVVGAEALVRWNHPRQGMLPPAAFITLAENNPLAVELGEWVIEKALQLIGAFDNNFSISINIFPYHIQQKEFANQLADLLSKYPSSNPHRLKLEITEMGTIEDYESVIRTMKACSKLGVKFSLDDFGTGHSSLNQLRTLPVDEIKIDRSFINEFLTNETDYNMVSSIALLADKFNLMVVAEGVETLEQHESLRNIGCTRLQGYYFAKPMPLHEFERWAAHYPLPVESRNEEQKKPEPLLQSTHQQTVLLAPE